MTITIEKEACRLEDGVLTIFALGELSVKILNKEANDRSGLIYGMGHAVYTLSDPRAVILKKKAFELAEGKEIEADFRLLNTIERLTP